MILSHPFFFLIQRSSEDSESRTTLACDEGRQLSPFANVTSEKERTAIVSERSDHLENKRMDPSMTEDVEEKAERLSSACEQAKEETQQISEKFQRVSADAEEKITPTANISKLIKGICTFLNSRTDSTVTIFKIYN